jgi:DNA-binding PadR family transcriptional regulator
MLEDFHLTRLQDILLQTVLNYKHPVTQIAQAIIEVTGLSMSCGTLYPYLKKLERHGLIEVHWPEQKPNCEGRPKLHYLTSADGRKLLEQLERQRKVLVVWQPKEKELG